MFNPYFKFLNKKPVTKIEDFYKIDTDYVSKKLSETRPEIFEETGAKMAIELFAKAAKRVPAYKDFLKKNKVSPEKIKTIKDFALIPPIDKNNYILRYPLESLAWDGRIDRSSLISVSSGSSGIPFHWPRGDYLELESSFSHELLFKKLFQADKHPTLFIITFSMGIYIAGIITLNSVLRTSQKGSPITIVSPGINISDTLRLVKELAPKYKQTIIAGYPPFVKDIIEKGNLDKVGWKKYNVKFLFATEGFSEKWRQYILKNVGKTDTNSRFLDSYNIYGSAEAGILGHETPITNWIRTLTDRNKKLAKAIFGRSDKTPTFVQYNPLLKFYETLNEELLFSTYGGIPLIRYNIKDTGKNLSFAEVNKLLRSFKRDFRDEVGNGPVWKLPFLTVFGKSDNVITLYGVNIYPENIKGALESPVLSNLTTGKFVGETKNGKNYDQYIEISIELKEKILPSKNLELKIQKVIINSLKRNNLEYKRVRESIGNLANPEIRLKKYHDPKYFPQTIKHRWKK